MDFCSEINDMLMKTYRTVQEVEETKVKRNAHLNLTISELHLMEYIGRGGEGRDDFRAGRGPELCAAVRYGGGQQAGEKEICGQAKEQSG